MPFGATEVLLRKSLVRIGYDTIKSSHTLILDALHVLIEAKPMEEGASEAITMHVKFDSSPQKTTINEATVIFSRTTPSMLEEMQESLSSVTLEQEYEEREENHRRIYIFKRGLLINITPRYRYVEYTLGDVTLKAETLKLEAWRPTLVNTLLERIQTASIYYLVPVEIHVVEDAGETRVTVKPLGTT